MAQPWRTHIEYTTMQPSSRATDVDLSGPKCRPQPHGVMIHEQQEGIEDISKVHEQQNHLAPTISRQTSYADSLSRAASTILSDASPSASAADDASLHSRVRLWRPESLSSTSSQQTMRAQSLSTADNAPLRERERRSTYVAGVSAGRRMPKPKKTAGRKAFELICDVMDVVVPIDLDPEKTTMRQSHMARLIGVGDKQRRSSDGASALT